MALFEGSVAFVMIGAVMKSMDPSLEEASQVIGAGRLRTLLRITLPLVLPGVLGAAIFVFAEMLGSFAVALVLGTPSRYYVITTAIYQLIQQYPPRIQVAAARLTGRLSFDWPYAGHSLSFSVAVATVNACENWNDTANPR